MSWITGPLFKWFGSKWRSGPSYPLPEYDTIVEPFAGGAGYSLRYPSKKVILYEADLFIYDLWKWLINEATEQDIRDIPCDLPPGTDIRTLGLAYGQGLLLKNWQRTNNVGYCWKISIWNGKPGQWSPRIRDRVAEEFYAIRHWKMAGRDGYQGFNQNNPCTYFVDPPYEFNFKYLRGTQAEIAAQGLDYAALAGKVLTCKGQKIVCEAVCPKTGRVPSWLPFREFGTVISTRRNTYSKELIWTG